jgi:two-component system, NarL family, nitrate/nitrite response regulator NarL
MEGDTKTRIMLVDDHPLFLEGVRERLLRSERIEIVGQATSAAEALARLESLAPDVVLLDISLPDMDGLTLISRIRRENIQVKVAVLTMHSEKEYVLQALRAGAQGYLLKSSPSSELLQALEALQQGKRFFSSGLPERVIDALAEEPTSEPHRLTQREREILRLVSAGLSSKEIAERLNIGVRTVEKHRENCMKKLGTHSVVDLTRMAIAQGFGMES